MALFICTAGTSIAEGGPLRAGESLDEFRSRIDKKIATSRREAGDDPLRLLYRLSAETNGLARADCGPGDDALILATDTPDGLAAAEAVVAIVAEMLGATGRARAVAGLQVTEAARFRQSGLRNLIDIVLRETAAARATGSGRVIFNVTGGFKGVVPYLTVLGMLNEIETVYVYDFSDALIRLPPLPLRFDEARIAFALPALRLLQAAGSLERERFDRLLPGRGWNDDPVVKDLVEEVEGLVALSAAGELALRGATAPESGYNVKLHRVARASPMIGHQKALRALRDMRVPQSFDIPTHREKMTDKSDMLIWKTPRGAAAPRLFYWITGRDVFVAEILHHAVYDREIVYGSRRVVKSEYVAADFAPFETPAASPDPLADAFSDWIAEIDEGRVEMERRVDDLERGTKELREQLAYAERQRQRLKEQLESRRHDLDAVTMERDELAAQLRGGDDAA